MLSILNGALSWAITSFGNKFNLKQRSRLIKALDNGFYVKFMQLEIGLLERLRNENEDKTKTQMTQSFNQYSENETKIWRQNVLIQFNRVSSSCIRSHFVISLLLPSRR